MLNALIRTKQSGLSEKKPESHRKNNLAFIYEIHLCYIKKTGNRLFWEILQYKKIYYKHIEKSYEQIR